MVQEKKFKIDFQAGYRVGQLGFPIGTILATFDLYKSSRYFLSKFGTTGFSVQEKNIDFQDSSHGGIFGFSIGTTLAIFDLQVNPILPIKYQVSWLSVREKELK